MKAITVKELIEELKKCNPDAPVEVQESESGANVIGVNVGNPASVTAYVTIETE